MKKLAFLIGQIYGILQRSDLKDQESGAVNMIFPHSSSWVILSPIEQRIKEKIEKVGVPLKNWDIQINYGIKTGCNEAFIIDKTKRDELIELSPNSVEIIRPILRGRDIKRYGYDFADTYLLNVHNGIREKGIPPINIDDYPAVKAHLDQYWDKISIRDDRGKTPYNLRNCAYMDDFSKPKIMYAEIMRITKADVNDYPRFCLIKEPIYSNNSIHFFTGNNLDSLVCLLNSEYATWWFFNTVAVLDAGGMQMRKIFVENIPLPKLIKNVTRKNVDEMIYQAFKFSKSEVTYIQNVITQKQSEILNASK